MASPRARRGRQDAANPRPSLALWGETLLVGIFVAVAGVFVVTAVPALAAGVRHLRRHLRGERDGIAALVEDFGLAFRRLWVLGAAVPLVLAFLYVNYSLARGGALPGGTAVAAAMALIGAGIVVVVLRTIGTWSPEEPLRDQLSAAAERAWSDPAGSVLVLSSVVVSGVLIWMLLPMFVLVGGLMAMAALAVESRRDALNEG